MSGGVRSQSWELMTTSFSSGYSRALLPPSFRYVLRVDWDRICEAGMSLRPSPLIDVDMMLFARCLVRLAVGFHACSTPSIRLFRNVERDTVELINSQVCT